MVRGSILAKRLSCVSSMYEKGAEEKNIRTWYNIEEGEEGVMKCLFMRDVVCCICDA